MQLNLEIWLIVWIVLHPNLLMTNFLRQLIIPLVKMYVCRVRRGGDFLCYWKDSENSQNCTSLLSQKRLGGIKVLMMRAMYIVKISESLIKIVSAVRVISPHTPLLPPISVLSYTEMAWKNGTSIASNSCNLSYFKESHLCSNHLVLLAISHFMTT